MDTPVGEDLARVDEPVDEGVDGFEGDAQRAVGEGGRLVGDLPGVLEVGGGLVVLEEAQALVELEAEADEDHVPAGVDALLERRLEAHVLDAADGGLEVKRPAPLLLAHNGAVGLREDDDHGLAVRVEEEVVDDGKAGVVDVKQS